MVLVSYAIELIMYSSRSKGKDMAFALEDARRGGGSDISAESLNCPRQDAEKSYVI